MGASATMVVSTKFTANDSMFSAAIERMSMKVQAYAGKAEVAIARADRAFRKMTPAISGAAKQFLSFASAAAISTAIVGGIAFSVDALKDYETALASFRTIVSDATDNEFQKYKQEIGSIASETKASTVEVAGAFQNIAGLNAKFAETAEGLGEVSKAAITLSKASGDNLQDSAANLVGIMNQFNLTADQSNRAINVLAAGQAVGAASITQSSEAYKNFGAVAASANITLEQSQALIQTLASKSILGAEAGTKLRGVTLKLQQASMGYATGQFQINDALGELKGKLDKLKTAKQRDALLTKTFGAENISAGLILLNNIDLYKEFTASVTGTTEAQKAATINTDTFSHAVTELKNTWVNMITTSDKASGALTSAKNVVKFLTENLDTIVSVGTKVLLFFAAWKTAIILGRAALMAYNIQMGIMGALTGKANIAIGKNIVALRAYKIASAMASPVGALTLALSALAVAAYAVYRQTTKLNTADKISEDIRESVADKTLDQRVEIEKLFNALRTGTIGSEKYNAALRDLEQLQPGIIEKYRLEKGEIMDLTRAHDELIKTIERRAEVEARSELYSAAVKDRLIAEQKLAETMKGTSWEQLTGKKTIYGRQQREGAKSELANARERESLLLQGMTAGEGGGQPTPFISPSYESQQAMMMTTNNTNNARVTLDVNDPNNRTTARSDSDMVKINMSSTMGY